MARLRWVFLTLFYFIVAVVIYSPSLSGPWQYDDHSQILDKEVLLVHSAPNFFLNSFKFFPEANGRLTNRDLVRASFRLNWDWWGNNPLGYRWVNLLIHVVNATLVALLVWLLLAYNNCKSYRNYNRYIPALAGMLFLVHPINSQAVAYIAQRFTSLTTLFYLGAVVCYVIYNRYNNYKYYIAALISATLAFSSKEISITLPVVILLVVWFAVRYNNYRNHNRYKVYLLLLPFFVLSLKIPLQQIYSSYNGYFGPSTDRGLTTFSDSFALKQTAVNLSRHNYFLTQINVVRTYERLLFLPFGQTLDWDYPLSTVLDVKTIATLIFHISLILIGILFVIARSSPRVEAGLRRGNLVAMTQGFQLIGLGILWFYLTLLPESSVIPIIDVIYEHRVYLPMVGVCLAFAGFLNLVAYNYYNFYKHYKFYIFAAVALYFFVLSVFTFNRVYVWGDQIRLWADAVVKAPRKARTNKNYGVVLAAGGRYEEGIKYLLKAIELKPDDADYHSNLGTAYLRSNQYQLAADQFQKAFDLYSGNLDDLGSLTPKNAEQLAQYSNDYGVANVQMGNGEAALEAFKKALKIDPSLYSARLGLGAAYNTLGNQSEAIQIFSQLAKEYPDQTDALNNLAVVYEKASRYQDAYLTLLKLQTLDPKYPNIKERIKKLEKLILK